MNAEVTQPVGNGSLVRQELCALVARGLKDMLYPESQLFCYKLNRTPSGMVREGISPRYTIMTVLGLHRYETEGGVASPIPIDPILEALFRDLAWVDNIGELGLLLWLCAMVCPEQLGVLKQDLDIDNALERFVSGPNMCTMELSWFLAGLAHVKLAKIREFPQLDRLAAKVFALVIANQGPHGTFGHAAPTGGAISRLRARIGSFADQVYPTYALSKFGMAFDSRDALTRARQCGNAICEAQGDLGQWWWHYDSGTGRVFQHYPVYSVHQHAMGPMALLALSEATGLDVESPISKGLRWIDSANELNVSMRDETAGLVWRSIFRANRWKMYSAEFLDYLMASSQPTGVSPGDLEICYECRPYESGWLLYAFGGDPAMKGRA